MKRSLLKVGSVTIGGGKPAFILGPCVIESEKFVWRMARKIAAICKAEAVPFIFKASYDKANRTSVRSYRGIGVEQGCEILAAIGAELKIPVTTDVHSPAEAEIAGHVIDVLQIPAFLCRQTDLLEAAAETGRVINVKKGQFLARWEGRRLCRLAASGCCGGRRSRGGKAGAKIGRRWSDAGRDAGGKEEVAAETGGRNQGRADRLRPRREGPGAP